MFRKRAPVLAGGIFAAAAVLALATPVGAQGVPYPGYVYYGPYYYVPYYPAYIPPVYVRPVTASAGNQARPATMYGAGQTSAGGNRPDYYSEDYAGATVTTPTADPKTARIRIRLPADAELWIDGSRKATAGTVREFETPELDPERVYTYAVRARWLEDGITVEKSIKVKAFAGNRVTVNFVRPAAPPPRTVAAATVVRSPAPPEPAPQVERAPTQWTAPYP
jgi:uncharacterized protein (TIGR03000 family)